MRIRLAAAFIAVCFVSGSPFAQGPALPLRDRLPFGAQMPFPNNPNFNLYLDLLQDAGVKWVRFDLCWWSLAEATPGVFEFQLPSNPTGLPWLTDTAVQAVRDHGMEPFVILSYTNDLYDSPSTLRDDAWIEAYARYCYEAALRYKDQIDYYEVWNEPNLAFFWGETVDPALYARTAIRAAERIREADPDAVVVGGAVSGIDNTFLGTAFNNGLLGAVDAITVHPYRINAPETIGAEIAATRGLIAGATSRDIPVWTGEWGYNTYWTEIGPNSQAKALARMFTNNLRLGIDLSLWFSTHPFCEAAAPFNDCGAMDPEWALVDYANQPRPSLRAFEAVNGAYAAPMEIVADPFQTSVVPRPGNTIQVLAKTGSGQWTLALWRATWPISEGLSSVSTTVTISPTAPVRSLRVVDGLSGLDIALTPQQTADQIALPNFPLRDYPVFLLLEQETTYGTFRLY